MLGRNPTSLPCTLPAVGAHGVFMVRLVLMVSYLTREYVLKLLWKKGAVHLPPK